MNILSRILKKNKKQDNIQLFNDDIFLVSYPKSGNTWVRFLIANIIKEEGEQIDFHTAVKYVPEYGVHHEAIEQLQRPRIMKSHQLYNPVFSKVVYIVRDPRDVYVSYYHYLQKKLPVGTTFSDFIRKEDIYPSSWAEHVKSWENRENVLAVFRYEDLLTNPLQEVKKLIDVLRLTVSDEKVAEAVKASSFSEMRKLEEEKGRPFKKEEDKKTATAFVRKGKQGDWINYFSKEDLAYISQAREVAARYGYEL